MSYLHQHQQDLRSCMLLWSLVYNCLGSKEAVQLLTDRQIDRQIDRQTNRQIDRQIDATYRQCIYTDSRAPSAPSRVDMLAVPCSPPVPWGSAASLQHSCSPPPTQLLCRLGFCAAPYSVTSSTCAQRQREERKHRMCLSGFVKRIYIYFFLEVAVNIVRQGKEQAYICAMRYRNISIGILLYSQFPYPQQHADKSRTAILYTVLQLSALSLLARVQPFLCFSFENKITICKIKGKEFFSKAEKSLILSLMQIF